MSDSEHTSLMPETQGTGGGQGGTSRKKPPPPDWGKYGLSQEPAKAPYCANVDTGGEAGYQHADVGNKNELFQEDQNLIQKMWWKANFFISEPVLFGTWDGVFTSCMINLLGVVIFLRMGWIVGNAGIVLTILTIVLAVLVVLIVALSGIGVCERCKVESGGVYFLISHVLGSRIGGSVGVVYCFAQAVTCSLSVMGFGESIMGLTGIDNPWIAKGVAIALVILLLGINIAGVKWVIRLQLVLLFVLFLSVMDFFVGSFVHTDKDHGVTGYREFNLHNNSGPAYLPGETFFSIFGLFFSTVTGILAGINMSGDLREPFVNIPRGTLSALGVSTFLYIGFTLVIGATCLRENLHKDYMISEKISIVGFLWLAGLYISSVSACMGSLYGPPRILQTIANENVIPIIRVLGHGRGPNKVPIYSLVLITLVVLLFVLVGDVNTLAPIVTTAFMMSYAAVNYSYFALAMSYDHRQARDLRFGVQDKSRRKSTDISGYGATSVTEKSYKDSFQTIRTDLDKLFPERLTHRGQHHLIHQQGKESHGQMSPSEPDFDATQRSKSLDNVSEVSDSSQVLLCKEGDPRQPPNMEITKQPRSWYSFLCNRWLSLFGTLVCGVIMFGTQWIYALVEVIAAIGVYIYIGQSNPGYFPGIAEFNFYNWMKSGLQRCISGKRSQEEVIVAPTTPAVTTLAAQLTEDNEDFAGRGRYHQSEVVQGENFDDYADDSES
ncbi:solute carrier family 12 member 8-like [Ruditapes philippinarum]|uniref:solute carrier family 12 member 8-like n=1 Tax=Ruditapes philippinarum TaxID=129788 RepID=UPI00295B4426|nr:solute carrier family 12 member 8-like [Ruditapes philippinarum]XP_060601595.1 solute carrier family 12 member 8-like [Ruditapes philippinarum]XP_060601596.1 solute carrier family 12 member 8-like [Ruditapes philippinarum]